MSERRRSWASFAAWAIAGGLSTVAILTGFSIGIFVAPVALLVVWLAVRRASRGAELLGLAAGVGAILLLVAFLNRDYTPCPDGPVTLAPGQTEFECGGFDPLPWLVAGAVVVAVSLVVYAAVRMRPTRG